MSFCRQRAAIDVARTAVVAQLVEACMADMRDLVSRKGVFANTSGTGSDEISRESGRSAMMYVEQAPIRLTYNKPIE